MITLLLMLSAHAAPSTWFEVGPDRTPVVLADGHVGGMAVRRLHAVLVHADDPAALAALPGVTGVRTLRGSGHVVRLALDPSIDEAALSRQLRDRPDVRWAHPDLAVPLSLTARPDDPGLPDQWHLINEGQGERVVGVDANVEGAWALTHGEGVTVAVIDGGTDLEHPDLRATGGRDYLGDDDDPRPDGDDFHGTAVAGIIGAVGDNGLGVTGVAWGADLYAIRMVGSGDQELSDIYDAFIEAVDAGADVINNSWGFTSNGCPDIPQYDLFTDAFDYAETVGRGGLGTLVVVASGNEGCDITDDGFQRDPYAFSVGALSGNDRLHGYSNFGPTLDIVAPSGGILTTDVSGPEGYPAWGDEADYTATFSGTSAAAPVVSGVAALMFAVNPRLTAAQARDLLRTTAVKADPVSGAYDAEGFSTRYGYGRVDATAAVYAALDASPTAPEPVVPEVFYDGEAVVITWPPSTHDDPDALSYEVRLKNAKGGSAERLTTDLPRIDVTELVETGRTYTLKVWAIDRFGRGPESAEVSFIVSADAPPACGHGGGAGWLALLGLGLLRRRR